MANTFGDNSSKTTLACSLCRYPEWGLPGEWTDPGIHHYDSETILETYQVLVDSANSGCHGCIILQQAWTFVLEDESSRAKSELVFNNRGEDYLYVHVFCRHHVHPVDIFTLPGT